MLYSKYSIMKIRNTFYLLLFIAIVMLFPSCKKGLFYDGINDNPIELKTPTPKLILPPILKASGYMYGSDESRFTTSFVQHITGISNQAVSANIYNISSDDVNNMWTSGLYGVLMNNAHDLIVISKKLNQKYYHAIGQIIMANLLQRTTDLWGDIPYTQAFLGEASKHAAFDSQESIYDAILLLLNSAIAEINAGDDGTNLPGNEDYLYSGDMEQWRKLAFSLKARCFIHLSKQDPVYADSVLLATPHAFESGDDDAKVPFNAAGANPIYQFNQQRGDISYEGTLQDMLIEANDPRMNVYYDAEDLTQLGPLYGSENSPIYLLTYDELQFIEAEAQFSKENRVLAAIAYNRGVIANLQRNGIDISYAAEIERTGDNITMTDIMTQKYIALFLSPESWTDWRRRELPVLTPTPGNVTGGIIPKALPYPSSEVLYNRNTPKGRTLMSRLWWDTPAS